MDRKVKLATRYLRTLISEEIELREQDAEEFGRDAATSSILQAKPDKPDKKVKTPKLKSLSKGDIKKVRGVMNSLVEDDDMLQTVLNPKSFREVVSNAIRNRYKGIESEEDKDSFAKEVAPFIAQIRNEIVKILSGDFSNLVKENKEIFAVHPVTYNVIKALISKGDKE